MRLIDADALIQKANYEADGMTEPFKSQIGVLVEWLVDKTPTIEPELHWIPCSERLPEDDTLMLVNYIDNRPEALDIWIGWHAIENVWYIDGEAHSKEYGNEVIAWMPLPEPYKENSDG